MAHKTFLIAGSVVFILGILVLSFPLLPGYQLFIGVLLLIIGLIGIIRALVKNNILFWVLISLIVLSLISIFYFTATPSKIETTSTSTSLL